MTAQNKKKYKKKSDNYAYTYAELVDDLDIPSDAILMSAEDYHRYFRKEN